MIIYTIKKGDNDEYDWLTHVEVSSSGIEYAFGERDDAVQLIDRHTAHMLCSTLSSDWSGDLFVLDVKWTDY